MKNVYSIVIPLRSRDCDMTGRWKPSEIFVAMQELGAAHSDALGAGYDYMLSRSLAFALTRMELHMERYPTLDQRVVGRTWVTPLMKWIYPRHFLFETESGERLGYASSLWVLMDLNERKMVNPSLLDIELEPGDLSAPIRMPAKPLPVPEDCPAWERLPVYSELDINGHVNNTRYVAWACDALGAETLRGACVSELLVNYSHEILPGQRVSLRMLREDSAFRMSGEVDGTLHFSLSGKLAPAGGAG